MTAYPKWIIPDVRFPNELEAIKERSGITIRVWRPENGHYPHPVFQDVKPHPSETALDDAKFDYTILNSGTLDELRDSIREILRKERLI